MNAQVELDKDALAAFCRKWRIRELSLFGSALRDDFSPESDLDFLVSCEPETRLDIDILLNMKEELEARFGRPVDVVEKEARRNPWRKYETLRARGDLCRLFQRIWPVYGICWTLQEQRSSSHRGCALGTSSRTARPATPWKKPRDHRRGGAARLAGNARGPSRHPVEVHDRIAKCAGP